MKTFSRVIHKKKKGTNSAIHTCKIYLSLLMIKNQSGTETTGYEQKWVETNFMRFQSNFPQGRKDILCYICAYKTCREFITDQNATKFEFLSLAELK